MPQVDLSQGETRKLLELDRFDAVNVSPVGGDIRTGKAESAARRGEITADGDRSTKVAPQPESLYVYAEADCTVSYRRQGFLELFQPREQVNTDIVATSVGQISTDIAAVSVGDIPIDITATSVGNVPINIDSVGVTSVPIDISAVGVSNVPIEIDTVGVTNVPVDVQAQTLGTVEMDIAAQTISDVGIDIQNQSLSELNQDTTRVSANGVVESNADQAASLAPSTTQTTTVRANSGEVWYLVHARFDAGQTVNNAWGLPIPLDVELLTESQGVQLAAADFDVSNSERYIYDAGAWRQGVNTRYKADDTAIDDSNGFAIDITNTFPSPITVDDFENGVDSAWSFQTGDLTSQTGTVLEGSQSGEFTSANESNGATNSSFTLTNGDALAIPFRIDTQSGDGTDFTQFTFKDSSNNIVANPTYSHDGSTSSELTGTWSANTDYLLTVVHDGDLQFYQSRSGSIDTVAISNDPTELGVSSRTSGAGSTVNTYFDVAAPSGGMSADFDRQNRFQFQVVTV